MQISDDLRRAIVFVGLDGGAEGFKAIGTAFFVQAEEVTFLVTNQHIAHQFEDAPFTIRVNHGSDSSRLVHVDPLELETRWYTHPSDPDVDIAVLPFNRDLERVGFDSRVINETVFVMPEQLHAGLIGVGDACHAVGLFHLLAGTQRNLPIVHTGNIALMPGSERVPVRDWVHPGRRRLVDAYLVEMSNLRGLSGSPVFVRPSFVSQVHHDVTAPVRLGSAIVLLLGVWMSSWDARPETITGYDIGQEVRVPLGMGVVAPISKLRDILDVAELRDFRTMELRRRAAGAAL